MSQLTLADFMSKRPPFGFMTVDGRLWCFEDETPCDNCGQPVEKARWGQSDNRYNSMMMDDHPAVSECEFCGTYYLDGEVSI